MAGQKINTQVEDDLADSLDDSAFHFEGDGAEDTTTEEESSEGAEETEGEESSDTTDADGEGTDDTEGSEEGEETAEVQPKAAPAVAPQQVQQNQPVQRTASESQQQQPAPTFHELVESRYNDVVDHVSKQPSFKMSAEEAEGFDEGTIAVIERQSAKVYVNAMAAVSKMLHTSLPAVVQNLIGTTNNATTAEDQFYQDYPEFNKSAHGAKLGEIAHFVATTNQGLNRKQVSDLVAQMGRISLGTTPGAKPAGKQQKTPGAPGGRRVVAAKPFSPAAKSAGTPPARGGTKPNQKPEALFDINSMLKSVDDMG